MRISKFQEMSKLQSSETNRDFCTLYREKIAEYTAHEMFFSSDNFNSVLFEYIIKHNDIKEFCCAEKKSRSQISF